MMCRNPTRSLLCSNLPLWGVLRPSRSCKLGRNSGVAADGMESGSVCVLVKILLPGAYKRKRLGFKIMLLLALI